VPLPLFVPLLVATLLVAALGAVRGALGRAPDRWLLRALLALQALLLVQAVLALVRLLGTGPQPPSLVVFGGYLLLSVLMLPGGLALTVEERTRYGSLLLGGVCLVTAVLELRLRAVAS
jgi:hypothetical protein